MYPTNQCMDPYYSHFRNHTPYSYYPPPAWEAGHPRVMDPSYRPLSYGPWPHNAGMYHPYPAEFHCCCNHSYPPGYYGFRPSFPQELPPPRIYYHGPFPQHPNEYSSYFVCPHPYPVEQTPYDYGEFKSHCCGCSNHVCHGGEKSNVKIEEERPDGKPEREMKDADNSSIFRHPNNQNLWLPLGNIEGKENGKRYELPPQLLKGWVPVGDKREENVKQQGQDDQKETQFQWPIVWMPARYDESKQKANDLKQKDETEETPPSSKIKIVPLSWFEDQKQAAKNGSRDHSDRSAVESQPATAKHRDGAAVDGHHKTTPVVPRRVNGERKSAGGNYQTIPVLPEKETDEKKVGTYRTIPVMTQEENDEKKPTVTEKKEEKKASSAERQGENGKQNHSETPTSKHSKLPPVCLRVDPLPMKKSGNSSSRSPSPRTRKDMDKAKKDMNKVQSQNLESKQSDTKKHTVVPEKKEKSPEELRKGMGFSNETMPAASAKHSQEEEVPTSNDHQKVQASSTSVQENTGANTEGVGTQENTGAKTLKGGEGSTERDSEAFRANLSEADAAVCIQSAYRGYDVRRWQPLDKLRKIRDVHEQMEGIRKQLQSLEASSKKSTEKEQVAVSEAIMNLLLKLDTIQGLHACVREARKSVARELICLQEKLDSLSKQSSGNHTDEDERLDRAESIIRTAAPTLTDEASDSEEKVVRLGEAKETSSVNFMELCDAVPHELNMEVGQDADPSELKNQKEKLCTSTMEVPSEEGKAAEQVEFQGVLSTDMSAAALPEHSHDHHERQIEELYDGSLEVNQEEKKVAITVEGKEIQLVDSMVPSHDAAPTVDPSGQEKCRVSTGHSFYAEESNAGVSPAVTTDIKATTGTESLDNGLATDDDGLVEDQTREALGVEIPELKHGVSPAEETPDVIMEDSLVSLKDAEPHKHDLTTAADSIMSNVDEQPEEARNMNMQEQVADSTQDSTKVPDGTSEPAQATLLEPTSEFDSVPEQTVPVESNNSMQSEFSGKDDLPHVDQKNEELELTGGELDVQESNHSLAEGTDPGAETIFPELDSYELYAHEEVMYEKPETNVSLKSETAEQNEGVHSSWADTQVAKTDERIETPKEAPAGVMGASVEEVDTQQTQDDSTVCTVTFAEVESDNPEEDARVHSESKTSEEALSAFVAPDGVKDSDEKMLAEENKKLKALLQKLLASGNDQMEVIVDLSEKVRALERKLAYKKKPKVRVHRPARHATAEVH